MTAARMALDLESDFLIEGHSWSAVDDDALLVRRNV